MSASHRSLSRLPLSIFDNLLHYSHSTDTKDKPLIPPKDLRFNICERLNASHQQIKGKENVTTVGQLLRMTSPALLRALDPILTQVECNEMIRRICLVCAVEPISALKLLHQTVNKTSNNSFPITLNMNRMRHIPSGMDSLDSILKGGFRVQQITELVGQAGENKEEIDVAISRPKIASLFRARVGVGKTQLAMQLCVIAASYGQGSIYIDTEKKLSLHRLEEIAWERARYLNADISNITESEDRNHDNDNETFCYDSQTCSFDIAGSKSLIASASSTGGKYNYSNLPYKNLQYLMENVTVHAPGSSKELLRVISNLEEDILLQNEEANLPSIRSRLDNQSKDDTTNKIFPIKVVILDSIAAHRGAESAPERVAALFKMAQMLKRIADELQLAVIVINQVGSVGIGGHATAALGTSWHHCVSTRISLEYKQDPHLAKTVIDSKHDYKVATVVKSNVAGYDSINYEINMSGVCEIKDE